MSGVVKLELVEEPRISGQAHNALRVALRGVEGTASAVAVVIAAIGADGSFSLQTVHDKAAIKEFDMLSRAGAIVDRERQKFIA